MRKFSIPLFLSCLSTIIFAQNEISTLQKQLPYIKEDTVKARVLNKLASLFYNAEENDSCKKYGELALQLSNKLLNSDAVKRDDAYSRQCKMLKAKAIENIGSAMMYESNNAGIDTLKAALKLWNETGDKSGAASTYKHIADLYTAQNNYVVALRYLHLSLATYKEINEVNNIGAIYYNLGLNQRYIGNYGDALESNLQAIATAREVKDTSIITGSLLGNGFVYLMVKNFKEALKNQHAALNIFIAQRDSVGIATVYNDMGVVNMWAGNPDEALKNHSKALMIRKRLKMYRYVGSSYDYISRILQQQGKLEEALANILEGIKYAKLSGTVRYLLDCYNSAGDIYLKISDYQNSLKSYDTVLQISRNINDRQSQAEALNNIAGIFLKQNKTSEAITWLQKAVAIADTSDAKIQQVIYKNLSAAYAKKGDYKNAFESSIKYKQFSDMLSSREKTEKLTSLTHQLEFENKQALMKASQEKQLAVQQSEIERQKLVRNIIIAGLLLVIAFAVILLIRFHEKRKLNIALENTLTDLKSTQAQLIQREKMASLGELTAGISHEIQNPLNFVTNFSEVNSDLIKELRSERLKTKSERNDELEEEIFNDIEQNLEKILYHGKRADAIVKGMLQHARVSTDQKEPTDINKLADECLRLSYHGLRVKDKAFNATMQTDFDSKVGKVNIVPQDMGRVFLNLFNNAFYAVTERKKNNSEGFQNQQSFQAYEPIVSVYTKKVDKKVEIRIKDNGLGISQKVADKIFQPFFTTKPVGQGTGLGLSLSYDIITKEHGGEITVKSNEGEGAEFIIKLPIR